jgi:subtilisin family serine protease
LDLKWLASHATGRGVEVAVIDSGVDASHPALAGRISRGCVVAKRRKDQIAVRELKSKESTDSYGHGTAVAGIIAELAPEVKIVNVKVLDEYNCTKASASCCRSTRLPSARLRPSRAISIAVRSCPVETACRTCRS